MIPMMIIKIMNEEERIVARQSHELGPSIVEMGWSETCGLKLRGLMMFLLRVDSVSRVTKALIWISKNEEISVVRPEMGKITSSMERSEEFLNAQISIILGILQVLVELKYIRSRIMEMKGVIPLPPLTITRESCL